MLGEATTPRGKSYMAVVGKEKAQKELLRACLPFLRSHAHASLGLSTTLPSLDALPLGSFREPSPFDCTVLILHTDLHTEPLPLSSVTLNPARSSGCQASGSSELHPEFPASPRRSTFAQLFPGALLEGPVSELHRASDSRSSVH